ncbi:hypothetical protein C461_04512 [Halorubrum aidingense JCM 13560]|uniref:DUF8145 domain-containing protein n=1 Tax=Halorubrum aidingense JCM 13560 TaxID=1230454 RepID=M0PG22_9EURY|nr:hypothetical protein C461_04512 [Halorubrum aidingense JCM 13560]
MYVPADPPEACPACGAPYESVSRHADGFVVNLLDNDRYRRVCFVPAGDGDEPALDCYHHMHRQVSGGTDGSADEAVERGRRGRAGTTRVSGNDEGEWERRG